MKKRPRQSVHNPYTGVCSIFSSRILNKRPIIIYEDGNQTRDFIFVRDVARVDWLGQQGPVPESFTDAERELKDAGVVRSTN